MAASDLGLGSLEGFSLAGFDYWLILGINIVLSTIIGGAVLLVVVGILSKKYGENVNFANTFVMALAVNVVNFFGVIGILGSLLPVPFIGLFLPLLVWIGLSKFFFSEMSIFHILLVAVIGYALTILLVPPIASIIRGMLPI